MIRSVGQALGLSPVGVMISIVAGFRGQAGCFRGQAERLSYAPCALGLKKTPLKIAVNQFY
jgi:hypothetical protein